MGGVYPLLAHALRFAFCPGGYGSGRAGKPGLAGMEKVWVDPGGNDLRENLRDGL